MPTQSSTAIPLTKTEHIYENNYDYYVEKQIANLYVDPKKHLVECGYEDVKVWSDNIENFAISWLIRYIDTDWDSTWTGTRIRGLIAIPLVPTSRGANSIKMHVGKAKKTVPFRNVSLEFSTSILDAPTLIGKVNENSFWSSVSQGILYGKFIGGTEALTYIDYIKANGINWGNNDSHYQISIDARNHWSFWDEAYYFDEVQAEPYTYYTALYYRTGIRAYNHHRSVQIGSYCAAGQLYLYSGYKDGNVNPIAFGDYDNGSYVCSAFVPVKSTPDYKLCAGNFGFTLVEYNPEFIISDSASNFAGGWDGGDDFNNYSEDSDSWYGIFNALRTASNNYIGTTTGQNELADSDYFSEE